MRTLGGAPWRGLSAIVVVASMAVGACSGGGGGPTPTTDPGGTSGTFSLLTYNVAGLPQEISTENPQEHIPLISPLLDEYDVVLTQEDFDWWTPLLDGFDFVNYHTRLRAEVTHEHRSARHPGPEAAGLDPATRPDLNVGDGNGLLSRFPFTGETRVAWAGCFGGFDTSDGGAADCLAMKGFIHARLTLADGAEVDVYGLHAEAGGTAEDQRLQVEDFDQLAAYIEEHSAGRAVILGGDTNLHTDGDHPDSSGGADAAIWQGFLDRTGLADTCTEALGCTEPGAIDKVAIRSGGGVTLEATSHAFPRERFRAPDGEDLSDHPPLAVDIAWSLG
jgi:endonuclease/exonuclease/phosphatase family metal-dependent hydrolase